MFDKKNVLTKSTKIERMMILKNETTKMRKFMFALQKNWPSKFPFPNIFTNTS